MTRRLALAAVIVACALLVWAMTIVLDHSAAATSEVFPARTAYASTAARFLARPVLPPSASAGPQASPSRGTTAAVAAQSPDVDSVRKPATSLPNASDWQKLAWCESRSTWDERTNPNYRGGLQIGYSEWNNYGGYHDPADAPETVQIERALQIWQARGWEPWNSSSACTGLR